MAFSAGAVIGVAFFDLAPEALEAGQGSLRAAHCCWPSRRWASSSTPLLDRLVARHDCEGQANPARGLMGAASFSAHSVLDGFAMGVAFQTSHAIGLVVAAAVLAHDFADGLNTVNVVTKQWRQPRLRAALAGGGCGRAGPGRGAEPAGALQRRRAGAAAGAVLRLLPAHRRQRACCRKATAPSPRPSTTIATLLGAAFSMG